jgi:hypothetical protein
MRFRYVRRTSYGLAGAVCVWLIACTDGAKPPHSECDPKEWHRYLVADPFSMCAPASMSMDSQRAVEHSGARLSGAEFDIIVAVGRGFAPSKPAAGIDTQTTEDVVVLGERVTLQAWRTLHERVPGKPYEMEVFFEALTDAGTVQVSVAAACRTPDSCRYVRKAVESIRRTKESQ